MSENVYFMFNFTLQFEFLYLVEEHESCSSLHIQFSPQQQQQHFFLNSIDKIIEQPMHFSLFVLLFCMSLFCRFVFVVFLRSFLYSHFANYCRRLVNYNEHESVVRVRLRVLLLLFSICWCSPLVFCIFFFFSVDRH